MHLQHALPLTAEMAISHACLALLHIICIIYRTGKRSKIIFSVGEGGVAVVIQIICYLVCNDVTVLWAYLEKKKVRVRVVDFLHEGKIFEHRRHFGPLLLEGSDVREQAVAVSTCRGEGVAASEAAEEAIALRMLLDDLGFGDDSLSEIASESRVCVDF